MQQRRIRRPVDGVLLLDKPAGLTSNAALQKARWLFNAAKAGHTGTLDPMATGLLPLTFGEATKFSQMLLDADKVYRAELLLGVATDSGDADGRVVARAPVTCTAEQVSAALAGFRGPILQVPPMFSALKREGRPLYEYARAGEEIERAPRQVVVHSLELVDCPLPQLTLRMRVSKGTYVRSLAMDLGAMLGCGAHLTGLCREAIGPFSRTSAVDLARLEACEPAGRDAMLHPVDALLAHLPDLQLDKADASALCQGRRLVLEGESGLHRVYGPQGFLGLGERVAGAVLHPRRLVSTQ